MAEKKWTIFNVPYGGGYGSLNLAKPKGTKRAPKALAKEFNRQHIFIADNGVSSWQSVLWENILSGFWSQNNVGGWADMDESVSQRVFDAYQNAVSDGLRPKNILFLGGSNSITASTYAAIAQMNGRKETGLILLDAHPDCCDKAVWPIHSDWLRWLLKEVHISPENILIIGLRQIEKEEKEFLDTKRIFYYPMNYIRNWGHDVYSFIENDPTFLWRMEKFRKLKAVYMSVDIDVVSGVFAPGTGCPSPGGFTDTEIISLVKQFKIALPNLRAADIVEINPLNWWRKRILRYDPTVDLGVRLIKEIIS